MPGVFISKLQFQNLDEDLLHLLESTRHYFSDHFTLHSSKYQGKTFFLCVCARLRHRFFHPPPVLASPCIKITLKKFPLFTFPLASPPPPRNFSHFAGEKKKNLLNRQWRSHYYPHTPAAKKNATKVSPFHSPSRQPLSMKASTLLCAR